MLRLPANFSRFLLLLFLSFSVAGCDKKDIDNSSNPGSPSSNAEILSYKIIGHTPQVTISPAANLVQLKFPETTLNGDNLIAEFSLTPGAKALVNNTSQESGVTVNNFERVLNYLVIPGGGGSGKLWDVRASNNDYSYDWGLGHFLKIQVSNNRTYEWYHDQGTTGVYSSVNCGPCAATMSIKWSDSTFNRPPEYARNFYGINGGWWYTSDINNYLNDNNIPRAYIQLSNTADDTWEKLKKQLDYGRIIILTVDMNYIRSATSIQFRVDKFYGTSPGWGHFLVVKGYKIVDNKRYYEVYDSYSNGLTYTDGTFRGKGRFYQFTDIFSASYNWWNYAFIIAPIGTQIDPSTLRTAIPASRVPDAWGY